MVLRAGNDSQSQHIGRNPQRVSPSARKPKDRGNHRRPEHPGQHHPGAPGEARHVQRPSLRRRRRNSPTNTSKKLEIKTPSADQLIKNLSGGNQQKVIFGALAGYQPRPADAGRTHPRHRHRHKGGDQSWWSSLRNRAWRLSLFPRKLTRCCAAVTAWSFAGQKKKVAELDGQEISEAAIMHYIAGGAENEPA